MTHCDQKTYLKANVCNNSTTPVMLNNINNRTNIHEQQINYSDMFRSMQYHFCIRLCHRCMKALVTVLLELLHLSFAYVLSPICSKALLLFSYESKLNSHIRLGWEYKRNSNTLSLSTTIPLLSIELQSRKSSTNCSCWSALLYNWQAFDAVHTH